MGLDKGFLDMLQAHVVWQPQTGTDEWGNETFGDPKTVQCFIQPVLGTLGDAQGNDRTEMDVTKRTEIMTDAIGVKPKDRIIVPPGGQVMYATEVTTAKDDLGDDLYQEIVAMVTERG